MYKKNLPIFFTGKNICILIRKNIAGKKIRYLEINSFIIVIKSVYFSPFLRFIYDVNMGVFFF